MKYRRIRLSEGSWSIGDVRLLTSFAERLLGIRGASGAPVLLLTRSVHTFTLRRGISVVELDLRGVVQSARVLPPGRILRFTGPRWVLEYGSSDPLPKPGTSLTASTIPEQCLESWFSARHR